MNLTRKDFIHYLALGGNFNRKIKLNRAQLAKLDKELLRGAKPIIIDDVSGYLDGKGYWSPGKGWDAH